MADSKKPFIIANKSPYYVYPIEGPRVLITTVIFNGKNYELWQKAVQTTLKAKKKLGFINGTLQKPDFKEGDDTSEFESWDMINSLVCSWIINVIDPKFHASMAYAESAKVTWDDLKRRYAVANAPKISQLKYEIAPCKQGGRSG